jgi:sarcosine oxidase subunit gamma
MADGVASDGPAVTVARCPSRGRINIRGDSGNPAFVAGVAGIVGVEPPTVTNTSQSGAEAVVLWLGPDEWQIEVAAAVETEIASQLDDALAELHASAVAVGNGHVTLSISGPHALDVLAKGMTLDLVPVHFPAGRCARSLLAKAPVLLHRPGDELLYEVTVARSFSGYAFRWLEDAAIEYLQPA